ncbi:MAG: glutamine--fructose-6-phosphate transaminase (isomerizing) [Actinomycetota bacterium]
MCGIVGFVGETPALGVLLEGLRSLEYRGYDSAGIALVDDSEIEVVKRAGKVAELDEAAKGLANRAGVGIGHTRWATCGAPTEANAHPHVDCKGRVAVVHNGIIENHLELRDDLESQGHKFASQTDSECLAHLIEAEMDAGGGLLEATRLALAKVVGSYAICVAATAEHSGFVAARNECPLVIALGDKANFAASDMVAVLGQTRRMVTLKDGQLAHLTPAGVKIIDLSGQKHPVEATEIDWDYEAAEKGGYEHFMLKEINEQPQAVRETLRGRSDANGRLRLDELRISDEDIRSVDKVFIVACGSSFHAGLVAKYAIEHWTRLPVEIDVASEFRYRDPVLDSNTLVVGISQSGETADTLAATRHAADQKARVIAITNVVGSSITREADAVLYTRAGPEVGVAATKTLSTQMTALWLLALWMAQTIGTEYPQETRKLLNDLYRIPDQMKQVLNQDSLILKIAQRYAAASTFLFIGRGVGYPVALEGALKLKELSYVHAEGFAAGEMKHGPIALLEPGVPVIAVATASRTHGKLLSNIEEAKARGAEVLAIANPQDAGIKNLADEVFVVPETFELLSPIIDVIPLQLFAYHIARLRSLDPDKPRNLAKSVTVE